MHASKLRLNVPTTVFSHLMLLVLVHKSKTTDRAVHFRTAVRAIQLFQALRQFSFEFQECRFCGGQRVVLGLGNQVVILIPCWSAVAQINVKA